MVCTAPPVLDETAPEAALVEAFAARIERFRSLYRALAPEFAAARY
jgi:xylulokinase